MVTLGEIVRAVGSKLLATRAMTGFQQKALWAIARCRTEATGADLTTCGDCGQRYPRYRSCGNRNCPGCQSSARHAWLEARERELLPVPYFHVVFTVPEIFNLVALYCPEVFYAALLQAAGKTLLDVGQTKLGLLLGCLQVLHTWGQTLMLHPHAHMIVPGGGFTAEGKWRSVKNTRYLLPKIVLRRRFRTLLCSALREAAGRGELFRLPADTSIETIIEEAWRQKWVVYVKPPFGGPKYVLRYLANYTHRTAISNSRIVSFDGESVIFRWRDYRDANRTKLMKLDAVKFLRRFILHVLPGGFIRIRYFGFMANAQRSRNVESARAQIGFQPEPPQERPAPIVLCPTCYAALARKRAHPSPQTPLDRPPPEAIAS